MLGVNVTYTMKPGKREEFLADIAACNAQEMIRKEVGCIRYDYFRCVEDPNKLLLVERWTNREAQSIHMTQPHMAQVSAVKERCTVNTELEFYDL